MIRISLVIGTIMYHSIDRVISRTRIYSCILLFIFFILLLLVQKTSKPQHAPQPQDQSLSTTPTNKDTMLARMLEMGFGAEESLEALESTNNDLENACAMLAQQSVDYGSKKLAPSLSLDTKHSPPTPPYSPAPARVEIPKRYM